ncbi:MAG: hypothetical protein K8T91_17965 [Planctomycetes bacterium]|nr:hypothetical protein [Planctomycetota bacterium]
MPPYYSVAFQYEPAAVRPDFLRDLYSLMLRGEFTYGGVLAWGCRGDLTLDQVIQWNQERLDKDFELGFTEHVSNNYRQVILRHPQYSQCRVIVQHGSRLIDVIVPEDDIFKIGGPFPTKLCPEALAWHTRPEQLEPLKRLALAVWQSGLIVAVQTYGELGAETAYATLKEGKPPSMRPFAIVEKGWVGRAELAARGIRVSPVGETGILLEPLGYIAESGDAAAGEG